MSDAAVPAGRGRRLVAVIVDLVVTLAVGLFVLLASGALEHAEDYAADAVLGPFPRIVLIAAAAYALTHGWWIRRGQTLGKTLLGVRVVIVSTGAPAGPVRMLARAPFFALWYVPFTIVPLLDAAFIFGPRRRCLHDRITGTMVVA